MNGLCGGETRSLIHTKVGEQPDQLTVQLAEGYTWYDKVRVEQTRIRAPGCRGRSSVSASVGHGFSENF